MTRNEKGFTRAQVKMARAAWERAYVYYVDIIVTPAVRGEAKRRWGTLPRRAVKP